MKILFDQGTPAPLRQSLAEHEVPRISRNTLAAIEALEEVRLGSVLEVHFRA